ncbi:MAG: transcription factor S [Candidatus Njordarchaeales archaeon]
MPEYCERCGSFMRVKEIKDNGIIIYTCPVCGWSKEVTNNKPESSASLVIDKAASTVVIIDESKIKRRGVVAKVQCPKCGNLGAYVEVVQTRAADEPPTRIYHCTKCGYTWREYS